jgi:hypothetical protein
MVKTREDIAQSLSLFTQESLAMSRALVIVEKTEIGIPSRRIYSAHCTHPLVLFPSTPFSLKLSTSPCLHDSGHLVVIHSPEGLRLFSFSSDWRYDVDAAATAADEDSCVFLFFFCT